MCFLCHFKLSANDVVKQLKDSVKNPRYEVWNSTSLSHLNISASGFDGPEARTLALRLLSGFIKWAKENNRDILAIKDAEGFLTDASQKQVAQNWIEVRKKIVSEIKH
jgi:hypothetical protein